MRRRDFIAGIAGSTVVLPRAARAQQTAMPVVGFLCSASAAGAISRVARFRQVLKETGYVEQRNAVVEYHWTDDRNERLPALAALM